MYSDGPGYVHMDEKGIVALGSTNHGQDEDEPSKIVKCPVYHAEATEKIDDVLT